MMCIVGIQGKNEMSNYRVLRLSLKLLGVFFSSSWAWSQINYCRVALALPKYFIQSTVKSIDDLNAMSRPLNDVWGRVGYDGRESTALIAKFKSLASFKSTDAFRGMWVTPEELIKITKEGLSASDGNYGAKIHFSADPGEAIRYGAQGARDKKGILILIAAKSKVGKIYPRDADEKGREMISVADDHVPPEAITSMWVFDPNPNRSEYETFRSVNLNAIRSQPTP